MFGNEPWAIALAVGLAIALMMLTKPRILRQGPIRMWLF
ncbi:hypothetical protein SD77_0835 [Bacillus badius]|uniref:Uncharacterized protein n=1 Tax=Bacillus badius TaxID=1455 RepID=A0ABR5AUC1_BACBA|nr:hypothetical protein SD78_3915 [Bacillus badius]KIL78234.1 hypothetical protein SD77_0835 [Bacillus badius]